MEREQILAWMQHPTPRNIKDLQPQLKLSTQNYRIAFYVFIAFCLVLLLVGVASVWNEGFTKILSISLAIVISVGLLYLLPWYWLYRRGVGGLLRVAREGTLLRAHLTQVSQHYVRGVKIRWLKLKFTDSRGQSWTGTIDIPDDGSDLPQTEPLPLLHTHRVPHKFLLLTPSHGLVAGNAIGPNDRPWLRMFLVGLLLIAVMVTVIFLANR